MKHGGYVYILNNSRNTVLYIGVTSDLPRRIHEHREGLIPGFTKQYNLDRLIYCESHSNIEEAIIREKQIKGKTRAKKLAIVATQNPHFEDLSETLF